MKKLLKHTVHSRSNDEKTTVIEEDDYVKVCTQAKEWILLTYSIYTWVLEFQYEEGRITSFHKIRKKLKYRNQRDQKLSNDFDDVESFIVFYYRCKQDLKEAINYAKLKTRVDSASA